MRENTLNEQMDGYIFVTYNQYSSYVECIEKDKINVEKYCLNDNKINNMYYICKQKMEKEKMNKEVKEDIKIGKIDDFFVLVIQLLFIKTRFFYLCV